MGRIITYFSVGTSAFALVYALNNNLFLASLICVICLLVLFAGFRFEAYVKTNGNRLLDRIVYFFTKNEKRYNILNKRIKYSYLGNDQYAFVKEYIIKPRVLDLDRMNDRFSWSVPSVGSDIRATEGNHVVNKIWQQEMWTCYTVYFNEIARKHKEYRVSSMVTNLVDTNRRAAPYLSNTIDKKMKSTTMIVTFPKDDHPQEAKFEVFSAAGMDSNLEERLEYDESIGGFKKTIQYPRKGWRFVISWGK